MELKEIKVSPSCMTAVFTDGENELFPYGSGNGINRVADLAKYLRSCGVSVSKRCVSSAKAQEWEVLGFSELHSLERTEYGFYATIYNSKWGGYSFRKFSNYSRSEAIHMLRKDGVVCPRRAYKQW